MIGSVIKRVLWLIFAGSLIIAVFRVAGGSDITSDPVGWLTRTSESTSAWFQDYFYPKFVGPFVEKVTSTDAQVNLPDLGGSTAE